MDFFCGSNIPCHCTMNMGNYVKLFGPFHCLHPHQAQGGVGLVLLASQNLIGIKNLFRGKLVTHIKLVAHSTKHASILGTLCELEMDLSVIKERHLHYERLN